LSLSIFLSHASTDWDRIENIATQARKIGVDPYMYEYDVQPGRLGFTPKIEKAPDPHRSDSEPD